MHANAGVFDPCLITIPAKAWALPLLASFLGASYAQASALACRLSLRRHLAWCRERCRLHTGVGNQSGSMRLLPQVASCHPTTPARNCVGGFSCGLAGMPKAVISPSVCRLAFVTTPRYCKRRGGFSSVLHNPGA